MVTVGNKYFHQSKAGPTMESFTRTIPVVSHRPLETQPPQLTTSSGAAVPDNQSPLHGGPRGPLFTQDLWLIEKMAHFNRERIYSQEGNLFRHMAADARKRLFGSIARHMAQVPREIQMRAICHFFRADVNYGVGVANALGINLEQEMTRMGAAAAR